VSRRRKRRRRRRRRRRKRRRVYWQATNECRWEEEEEEEQRQEKTEEEEGEDDSISPILLPPKLHANLPLDHQLTRHHKLAQMVKGLLSFGLGTAMEYSSHKLRRAFAPRYQK
jgi:hypothetical protein